MSAELGEVVADAIFPEVDASLREGVHIGRESVHAYAFVTEHFETLRAFYDRYGYDLVRAEAAFVYLRPVNGPRKRALDAAEMLVGQALALMSLQPQVFMLDGRTRRGELRGILENLVGVDGLRERLLKRKVRNERAVATAIREEVDRALRSLERLGFLQLHGSDEIELRSAIARFADIARGGTDTSERLRALVAAGELVADDEEAP